MYSTVVGDNHNRLGITTKKYLLITNYSLLFLLFPNRRPRPSGTPSNLEGDNFEF